MSNLEPLPSGWEDLGWVDETADGFVSTWGDDQPINTFGALAPSHPLIPEGSLQGYLGPNSKRVVINDYLPPGVMFMTEGEIILSAKGWEHLVHSLETRAAVREIVERELADVLAWLREAGHDV